MPGLRDPGVLDTENSERCIVKELISKWDLSHKPFTLSKTRSKVSILIFTASIVRNLLKCF